jgi:hypothetical protein
MKSINRSLFVILLGLGLVAGNTAFAQYNPDTGNQGASGQGDQVQSRDQTRDPSASGGQQQKRNQKQTGKDLDQEGQSKGQGQGNGQGQ